MLRGKLNGVACHGEANVPHLNELFAGGEAADTEGPGAVGDDVLVGDYQPHVGIGYRRAPRGENTAAEDGRHHTCGERISPLRREGAAYKGDGRKQDESTCRST